MSDDQRQESMQRNEALEALSDKVRKGEPVGFLEAIAVITYQENLRREREANSLVARLKRLLCAAKLKEKNT